MTNAEKFLEVFGFIPDQNVCPYPQTRFNENCKYTKNCLCVLSFWDDEYKKEVNGNA